MKAKSIPMPNNDLLKEIRQIKQALKNAKKVRSGKLKGQPVEIILNEL